MYFYSCQTVFGCGKVKYIMQAVFFIELWLVEGYKNNQGPATVAQQVAHLLVVREIIG